MKKVIVFHLGSVFDISEESLEDRTPLEMANTPHLDHLYSRSFSGSFSVPNIDDSFLVTYLMSLMFGYKNFQHSSVQLAEGLECELNRNDIVFKNNFVTLKPTTKSLSIVDPSGASLSVEDKQGLTEFLNVNLFKKRDEYFFLKTNLEGDSVFIYRREKLEKDSVSFEQFKSPYENIGREIDGTPQIKEQSKRFMYIMNESQMLLSKHPLITEKSGSDFFFPNSIWLYEGAFVEDQSENKNIVEFKSASVVSSNLILKGFSKMTGMQFFPWKDFKAKELFEENEFIFIDKEYDKNQFDSFEKVDRIQKLDNEILQLTQLLNQESAKVLFLFNYPYNKNSLGKKGYSFLLTEIEKGKFYLPRRKFTTFDLLCFISNAISPPEPNCSRFIEKKFNERRTVSPVILRSKLFAN